MFLISRAVRPGAVFCPKIKLGPMVVLFIHNGVVWFSIVWYCVVLCSIVWFGANGGFIHTAGTL